MRRENNEERDVCLRQVYFSAKPNQVQTELEIVYMNPKAKTYTDSLKTESKFMPSKKNKKVCFDFNAFTCEYH